MTEIEFWYSIGSTYTYLSVMRLNAISEQANISFCWRPFNVRAVMIEMDNIPFANKPVKAAYMWRDLGRRAKMYGLRPRYPVPYPLPDLEQANRVALIAAEEGWCAAYTIEAYRLWFEEGQAAGSEPNLSASIAAAGQDPQNVIERANSPEAGRSLAAATDKAKARGIFGSPSFLVADELFWGDDRLDDAIHWAKESAA